MKYFNAGGTVDTTTGDITGTTAGGESSLSTWVGDYVTDMLGKGQALADMGYQGYGGQMTAGPTQLQQQAFEGVAGLTLPDNMGTFTPQQFTADTASQYMNPYLQQSLDPQLAEAKRQAQIQQLADNTRLTKAGAYGGSRQAIMDSESNRNLLANLASITGEGYNTAFDQARQQFNTEQGVELEAQTAANQYGMDILGTQAELGEQARQIEQDALAADYAQFKEERDFPYKQIQYQQSLLQGLPIGAQEYSYNTPSTASDLMAGLGGILTLLQQAGFDLGGGSGGSDTTEGTGNTDGGTE